VGARRWFINLLSRGEAPDEDPSELVDLATVPLAVGPLLVASLENEGITVAAIEAFNVATTTRSHMRIMVRRDQFAAASQVLESTD
jgi:hypothetical protein